MLVLYSSRNSPCQNTGVGSLSLLQEIFPTQGSNTGFPHCGQILFQLSHQESPKLYSPWGCKELNMTKPLSYKAIPSYHLYEVDTLNRVALYTLYRAWNDYVVFQSSSNVSAGGLVRPRQSGSRIHSLNCSAVSQKNFSVYVIIFLP